MGLSRLLVLVAVLLMPFGMAPVAAAHQPMHTNMGMQHCPDQSSKHPSGGAFAECTMACSAALPAADMVMHAPPLVARPSPRRAAQATLHGLHPEAATPPPKSA